MGLDITAYGSVQKVSGIPLCKSGIDWNAVDESNGILLLKNHDFPNHCLDLEDGIYKSAVEPFRFRAGSYSAYDRFRNFLSISVIGVSAEDVWESPHSFRKEPFYELIDFSDCEGVIGPSVAAKLYKEFVDNESFFMAAVDSVEDLHKEWTKTCFLNWKQAFDVAKNGGFVSFN